MGSKKPNAIRLGDGSEDGWTAGRLSALNVLSVLSHSPTLLEPGSMNVECRLEADGKYCE
jgi:hypothetical protein